MEAGHACFCGGNGFAVAVSDEPVSDGKAAASFGKCGQVDGKYVAVAGLGGVLQGGIGHDDAGLAADIEFGQIVLCQPAYSGFVAQTQNSVVGQVVAVVDVADLDGYFCGK